MEARGVLPAARYGIKDLAHVADLSAAATKGANFGQIFIL